MLDASSEDKLLAYTQEAVAVKSIATGARLSIAVLKYTSDTPQNETTDGLVVSAAVKLGTASTRHITPNPKSPMSTDKNVGHRKLAKKRRSTGVLLKSQYQKAMHILSKIAKNKETG